MPGRPFDRELPQRVMEAFFAAGQLPGGRFWTVQEIAQRFGVSRYAADTAVRELVGKHLLVRRGYTGTFLAEPSTVGTVADDFAPANPVSGYLVLTNYNTSQVTYNSRLTGTLWTTAGLGAGTDRSSTAATVGVTNSFSTTFSGLSPVVQGWLDNTTPNFGLLFTQATHDIDNSSFTSYQNVVWTLDAVAVVIPEPSTVMLIALGGLLLFRLRSTSFGGQGCRVRRG